MHGSYPISNNDLRYVLAAFVVVPVRWLRDYGWRHLTDVDLRASVAFPEQRMLPSPWVRRGAQALIDPRLIDALGYPPPNRRLVAGVHRALRARAAFVRRLPPRRRPAYASRRPDIRSYRPGYDVAAIGTFPPAGTHSRHRPPEFP